MSLADARPSTPLGSAKIEPQGRIHLGRQLTLEQYVQAAAAMGFQFSTGLPEDGTIPIFENPSPTANPGELPRQELKYRLRETASELYIENHGLTMSYGIFGAPGSGKTYLMLRLLRQIVALNADDAERKAGALILDPKAALIED